MSSHEKALKQRPGDQPLPTAGRECVQDRLIEEIQRRRELGIQRYGSPLMTHNGRDAVKDAWEEAIDLAAYLTQVVMERADQAAQAAAAVTATLPHGGFTVHCNEYTTDFDNDPTVYVICACGRGYAFGRRFTDADLFGFLADHDGFIRKTGDAAGTVAGSTP